MSVNKAILVGNVGADPEIRAVGNDNIVANFRMATTERGFRTASGTEVPERTEWHNIVVWRGLAKVVEQYVRKGTQLYVEGKIQTRVWKDSAGNDRYTTEIVAENLELLGRRGDNAVAPLTPRTSSTAAADTAAPATKKQAKPAKPAEDTPFDDSNESSSDLPF